MSVPAAFDYHPATSVDEAIALLQQYGDDAKLLAGGHSLLPTMKLRLAQPAHLIDLGKISGLSYIREDDGAVAVGAMTTYANISPCSQREWCKSAIHRCETGVRSVAVLLTRIPRLIHLAWFWH